MNQMSHASPAGDKQQNNSMNGVQGPAALEKGQFSNYLGSVHKYM